MYSTNKYYNVSYNIPNPQTPVCLRTTATPLPSPFRCYRPISPAVLPPVASGRGRYLSAERIWKVLLFVRHLKSRSGSFFPQRVFFGPSAAYPQDSQLANFSTIVWFTLIRCRRRATRAFDPHQFAISAPAALPGGMLSTTPLGRMKTKLSPEMWKVVNWSLSAGPSELERQLDGDKQIGRSGGFLGTVNFYSSRQKG